METSSKYMKINGINTHYHEEGSGKEKMILIHGSGPGVSAFANWRLVIPRFSESLHVAYRRPDLVKKLILMGSVGVQHKISYGLDRVWGYEPSLQSMRELIELFSYDEKAAKNEELVRMRYEASIEPETRDAFRAMFFDSRQERLDELALPDDKIKKIKTETILFHGLNDQVIKFEETSYKLIQLLPHAELHLFNECGHWTQIEKTDEFIDHTVAFIKN